eukprot:2818420-Prymnesium_polylepis.2
MPLGLPVEPEVYRMNSGKLASTGFGAASSQSLRTSDGRESVSSSVPWQASTSRAREHSRPALAGKKPSTVRRPVSRCGTLTLLIGASSAAGSAGGASTAFGGVAISCSAACIFGTRLSHVTTTAAPVFTSRSARAMLA